MTNNFEATGDIAGWPKNEPNKPTHVAVFGVYHPDKGQAWEILHTGEFPELEKAMYWAAKKEMEAVRRNGWHMASRVIWQHDLTAEEAVAACRKEMQPQLDRAMQQWQSGEEPDFGEGPMKPVDISKAHGVYFEVSGPDGEDVVPPFVVAPDQLDQLAPFFEALEDQNRPPGWVSRDFGN